MGVSKIVTIILLLGSVILGYLGYKNVSKSTKEIVAVLGVKLETSNESSKREGYLLIGLAVLTFVCGIYTFNKSKN